VIRTRWLLHRNPLKQSHSMLGMAERVLTAVGCCHDVSDQSAGCFDVWNSLDKEVTWGSKLIIWATKPDQYTSKPPDVTFIYFQFMIPWDLWPKQSYELSLGVIPPCLVHRVGAKLANPQFTNSDVEDPPWLSIIFRTGNLFSGFQWPKNSSFAWWNI